MKVQRVIIDTMTWTVKMENGTIWILRKQDVMEFTHDEYGDLLDFLGRLTHIRDIPIQELERHGFYQK